MEEKINKVFHFENIYNETEKSLEVDTQYSSLILEDKKLTFQNFDFSDIKEFVFSDKLEIKRVAKDDSDGDTRFYAMPATIEKITSPAVPDKSDSVQLCLINAIEEIIFINCTLSVLKIDKSSNIKSVTLNGSIVKDGFEILKKDIESLNFSDSTFNCKVKIQNCIKIDNANFYNTKFKDLADFYQTNFNEVIFERADFEKVAVFSETEFNKDVNFKYVKFLGYSVFRDTVIKGKLDLRNTIFDSDADANFLDITSEKRAKDKETQEFYGEPKVIQVANRETAKIIKSFYEYSNNIIEANKFYALEMKEREKELEKERKDKEKRNSKTFVDCIIFKLHGISSNHSQDPLLALYWIIIFGMTASLYEIYLSYICLFSLINIITINLFLISPIIINRVIEQKFDKYYKYYLAILYFLSYCFIISNCSPIECENTMSFAKTINPFSIMKGTDDIDILQLLFKITIAYLIYQFIVSVRQNTRRK